MSVLGKGLICKTENYKFTLKWGLFLSGIKYFQKNVIFITWPWAVQRHPFLRGVTLLLSCSLISAWSKTITFIYVIGHKQAHFREVLYGRPPHLGFKSCVSMVTTQLHKSHSLHNGLGDFHRPIEAYYLHKGLRRSATLNSGPHGESDEREAGKMDQLQWRILLGDYGEVPA